jgi:prepilin-type N-terminal cleavage/methylation domain-containing protein
MLMKIRRVLGDKDRQRGFTLVELIIVMAVLTVLAAIAVPKYTGILNESKVKSDAVTAAGIASAARIQETSSGKAVSCSANSYVGLSPDYFAAGQKPSSGGVFALTGGGNTPYVVQWTPNVGVYDTYQQTLTEGSVFSPTTTPAS